MLPYRTDNRVFDMWRLKILLTLLKELIYKQFWLDDR